MIRSEKIEIYQRLCELEDQVYELSNRVDKLENKKVKKVKNNVTTLNS